MEIIDALKRPFTDAKTFIIGTLIGMVPILNFAVMGYGLECAKNKKKMPKFSSESWILGLKSFAVSLVYGLLFSLIALPILFFAAGPGIMQMIAEQSFNYEYLVPAIGAIIFIVLLGILTLPINLMAKLTLAKTEKISEAINLKKVIKNAYKAKFVGIILVTTLISFVLSTVLSKLPILGWMIAPYVATVFTWSYIGSNA